MGGVPTVKTIWYLIIIALVVMTLTAWFFPATPVNGLSVIAFALLFLASVLTLQKTER